MYLENLVVDAADPQRLGRWWESLLGTERLTDAPGIFETRLAVEGGFDLDLCFQQVTEPVTTAGRLHLDVRHEDQLDNTSGALVAMSLESVDTARSASFWCWLTGWPQEAGHRFPTLRHPSGGGPVLTLCPERAAKSPTKNQRHLDLRLEADDDPDEVEAGVVARGGRRDHHPEWGDLPWRHYADPSGNEFCVLAARR